MLREHRAEVLVTGAGPVGMLTALELSQAGVQTRIIDQEWRTASRTYACALHPRTLELLDRLALAESVLEIGRKITTVAFYQGQTRQGEAKLSQLPGKFPFVLVLPQSALENLLEQRLAKAGLRVDWNYRLANLRPETSEAVATVEKLGVSAKGYIIPDMDWSVEKTEQVRARYVVGVDGPNSLVAQFMGLIYEEVAQPEFFAVLEFESDWDAGDELRIVLQDETVNALWPLPGGKFRWSFQLLREHLRDFPSKERSALQVEDAARAEADLAFAQRLIQERAPWFTGNIKEISWSTDVEFQHRVATRFGLGHCWLAGDAVHQTGPAGMQSMNLGLVEADRLANSLVQVLRQSASEDVLDAYSQDARTEWRSILGLNQGPSATGQTSAWIKEHATSILRTLPASGADLKLLLNQLGLALA